MLLDLRSTDDIRDMVHRTVQALAEGQVVGFPTETVYVLAAHALNVEAIERLEQLVASPQPEPSPARPLTLSLRSREAADDFLFGTSPLVRRLTHRCWPGPLIVQVACDLQHSALSRLPPACVDRLTGAGGEIGFRVVDQRVLSQVHRYLAAPLVIATSESWPADHGGEEFPTNAASMDQRFHGNLPLLLDDGPTRYGGGCTVVHVTGHRWQMIRQGVIERAAMNQFVKPSIAVVCTGNTCRSPMAEVLLRELIRKRLGDGDRVDVVSAGVAAGNGSMASPQAVDVMEARGLDLSGHSSRMLDDSVVASADLILTMTRGHRAAILAAWPDLHDRVFTLRRDGGDITDPVGMPEDVYRQCAEQIEHELSAWLDSLGDDFFPVEN